MAKVWNTGELITEVRRIGAFNDVESDGKADADIINALDLVMMDEMLPTLISVQEEYLIRTKTVTTTTNQEFVDIPAQAVVNSIRDIWWSDANGDQHHTIPRINREHRPLYGDTTSDYPRGIYVEGDHIVLVPKSTGGQTINLAYMQRPGQFVQSTAYRKIVTVDSTTAVTLDSTVPTTWTTADVFDIHSSKSGAETRLFGYSASVVSGTGITFSALIDGTVDNTFAVEVGDYVVLEETAAVPGLPRELHPVLAQAAACRLLESDGDAVALEIARQTLGRQLKSFVKMAETRIEGKPHKIVNPNSFLSKQTTRGGW